MNKKYYIDDVKELLKDTPYTMIDETFSVLRKGFVATTTDNYKVIITNEHLLKGKTPEIFHASNPYTIENIHKYIENNNIHSTLLSNTYVNNSSKLKWKCECGNEYEQNWNYFKSAYGYCKECSKKIQKNIRKQHEFNLVKQYFKNKNYELLSTTYNNCHDKLEYICNKHKDKGIQTTTWASCKSKGTGCKYCANENNGKMHRLPEEQIKILTESKGFIYDHVEYSVDNDIGTMIFFICPRHLDKGLQSKKLDDMKRSIGKCNYCLGKSKTHDDFLLELQNINSNIEILSEYNGSTSNIKCRCVIDGYEWISTPNRLLQGSGCPKCGTVKNSKSRLKTHEIFEEEILKRYNGQISLLTTYIGSHKKIQCKCNIDNTIWETTPTNLLNSKIGCPTCEIKNASIRFSKSNEKFIEELSVINPNIVPLEQYKNENTKIKCECKIHNHIWYASPNKLLIRATGCAKCSCYHNESVIGSILDKWGYKYTLQKRFNNCRDKNTLPFDCYLDDFNILIEYDGEGHYKPIRRGSMTEEDAIKNLEYVQRHDKIKNDFCKKNKINLIRIPYWEKNDIEYYLFNEMIKYKAIEVVA